MAESLLEQLRSLQERLRRIVEEVERDPGRQLTLAQEMADIHARTEELLLGLLPAEQRADFLSARAKALGGPKR
jgi:hypothetical protein